MSDCDTRVSNWIAEKIDWMSDDFVEVPDDGPLAELARQQHESRKASIVPMWVFTLGDFLDLVLTTPLWGTALVIAWAERRTRDE